MKSQLKFRIYGGKRKRSSGAIYRILKGEKKMKMKKFGACVIVVTFLVAMIWSVGLAVQPVPPRASAKADVTAVVVPIPPTITKTRDLVFGAIMQGKTKKVRNSNGARFTVTGRGSINVPKRVTLRGGFIDIRGEADGIMMPMPTLTATITHDILGTISIYGNSKSIVNVGGKIMVPKGQMSGKYKGTLLVTVTSY